MNLILLQIITLASNVTAVVIISGRLDSKNKPINHLISILPLIKDDVWNLTLNIILIFYTIGTMIVVIKLFIYHIEILNKNLTTYQDIKLSSLEVDEEKLPFFFLSRNESIYNFDSKTKFAYYLIRKKILYRIKKAFFIPYDYYKTESNENIEFLQTAAAVINNNQKDYLNNYNSIPSSAVSNDIFDNKFNENFKKKNVSDDEKERNTENGKEKNLNVNFPCNQIKELITNNYNFNTNSNSYSNSEINTRNNNKLISTGNNNTKSILSQSNSKGKTQTNQKDENLINIDNFEIKKLNNENQINHEEGIKLNYIFKKIPNRKQRISKNMQKRMNQYLLNHNILNFENIIRDNSQNKDKNNIGSLHTINMQNLSSYYSNNFNDDNINLGEIHISEREKNNFNHVIKEINNNRFNNNMYNVSSCNDNENLIPRKINNYYSNRINPSPESSLKNQNKSHHIIHNKDKLQNFNLEANLNYKNENNFDKNKNIPRHFRINSNIDNLNQKNRKINSKQIGEIISQNNKNFDNLIDSNRNPFLDNNYYNFENPFNNVDENHDENRQINNQIIEKKSINDNQNNTHKSLNDKIVSIINSSGTVDDVDLSDNGKILSINFFR